MNRLSKLRCRQPNDRASIARGNERMRPARTRQRRCHRFRPAYRPRRRCASQGACQSLQQRRCARCAGLRGADQRSGSDPPGADQRSGVTDPKTAPSNHDAMALNQICGLLRFYRGRIYRNPRHSVIASWIQLVISSSFLEKDLFTKKECHHPYQHGSICQSHPVLFQWVLVL